MCHFVIITKTQGVKSFCCTFLDMAGLLGLVILLAFVVLGKSISTTTSSHASTLASLPGDASSVPSQAISTTTSSHASTLASLPGDASSVPSQAISTTTSSHASTLASLPGDVSSVPFQGSTHRPCGNFSVSETQYGITVTVDNDQSSTVTFEDEDGDKYSEEFRNKKEISLKPCTKYSNISVTQGSCTLKSNSSLSIKTKDIAADDINFSLTNDLLCYSTEWNMNNVTLAIPGDKNKIQINDTCLKMKKEDSCQNYNFTVKAKRCNIIKEYHVEPVIETNSLIVDYTSIWPPKIEWANRPQNCRNVMLDYSCRDTSKEGSTFSLDQLLPQRNYNCTANISYRHDSFIVSDIAVNINCDINISLENKTGITSVQLMWNSTSSQCPLLLHNLNFESCIKEVNPAQEKCQKSITKHNFTGLLPFTENTFFVKAWYGENEFGESEKKIYKTLPGKPRVTITIDHKEISHNSFNVGCKFEGQINGPNTIYEATIQRTGYDAEEPKKSKHCKFSYEDLYYLSSYVVKVRMWNGHFYSDDASEQFDTKYNNKALIGFLAFFIVFGFLAFMFVWYKIHVLQKRNSCSSNDELELMTKDEGQSLLDVKPITAELLLDAYKKKIANKGCLFQAEFQSIPKVFSKFPIKEAMEPSNQNKNRYGDILPYDHNRVQLSSSADGSDYINASFIDGYNEPKKYIATQEPKNETMVDFWRMVWEQQSSIIVMVTRCEEGNRDKCAQYWPSLDREAEIFEEFIVKIKGEDHFPDNIIRHFSVTNKREKSSEREVTHIQFTSWPDQGVPGEAHLLLKLHRRVRSFQNLSNGPIIVHCSAGVGPTGTYIGIDAMMEQLETEGRMDIYGYVARLQRQRCLMVEDEAQYILIHQTLLEQTQFGDTEIPLSEMHCTLKTLKQRDSDSEPTLLETEFQRLPNYIKLRTQNTGKSEENKKKNRYSAVVPYDYNRVTIKCEEENSHESEQNEDDIYQTVEDNEEYVDVFYTENTYCNASNTDGNVFNKNNQPQENTTLPSYKHWRSQNTGKSKKNKNHPSAVVPYYDQVLIYSNEESSREWEQDEDNVYETVEDNEEYTDVFYTDYRYINASYVDGYWGPRCIIATQGPLPDTRADFWLMIFQKKVKTVFMLTECMEGGKEVCSPYWSNERKDFGDIEVEMRDCTTFPAYKMRCIELRHSKTKENRKVYQYQFQPWTEKNMPERPQDLIDLMRTVKQKIKCDSVRPDRNVPIVVHCDDGSTRTGLFCALWNILDSAGTEKLVDIFQVVKTLRKERQGVIMSLDQYQFLYDTIESTLPAQDR
ncbi:receptor-type tyrosine-protein phosphatase C-like isoform X4 [Brienomyrus brachyistius]|uniref:receptor-type tyrosine-protein phosphatase C-like isoform X2 n=1 Tax=Brienomyrus brachyistius TaxID=42636 RepID=UPI0020B305FF|nr:receptor-type tyrosine-protein phosphatase C-like isoform X2 [Brienomyrus brachyistius]XP_048833709.1 receptor-type tyrosine-protein phosphatase C-like isoform X3 [Brienomyrus brachyistius]XP_048833710.1 receptor-type tyrosine-protein phosphatase C-like isoform X4 [Brienomyrus brachyistius]